jgi:hypothetical protein
MDPVTAPANTLVYALRGVRLRTLAMVIAMVEYVRQKSHGFCGAGCTAQVPATSPQCQHLGTREDSATLLDGLRSDREIECLAGSVT